MLKKRLIFTLLYNDGNFQLSRNFQLQNVGGLDWLYKCFNLESITNSIDELIILNVEKENRDEERFLRTVVDLSKHCFMPIALGGGINSLEQVSRYLRSGADKVVINSDVFKNPETIRKISRKYGAQVIIASIDYLLNEGVREIYISGGKEKVGIDFLEAIKFVNKLGVGELYLTSMDKDGTGQGFDYDTLEIVSKHCDCPLIASGGVGNFGHLHNGLEKDFIDAVSTANIFNFLASGLTEARKHIVNSGVPLATWDIEKLNSLRVDQC